MRPLLLPPIACSESGDWTRGGTLTPEAEEKDAEAQQDAEYDSSKDAEADDSGEGSGEGGGGGEGGKGGEDSGEGGEAAFDGSPFDCSPAFDQLELATRCAAPILAHT